MTDQNDSPGTPSGQQPTAAQRIRAAALAGNVTVADPNLGELTLSPLTGGQIDKLARLLRERVPPREFTVHAIQQQLVRPVQTIEQVRAWPDLRLLRVAASWAVSSSGFDTPISDGDITFDGFEESARLASDRIRQTADRALTFAASKALENIQGMCASTFTFQRSLERQASIIDSIVRPLTVGTLYNLETTARSLARSTSYLDGILHSIQPVKAPWLEAFDPGRWFSALPNLTETFAELRRAQQQLGAEALEETGYGFAADILFANLFAHLASSEPAVRSAAAAKSMHRHTSSHEFESELRQLMDNTILRRRLPIIGAALEAHRNRNYLLSIPALLAQCEGAIADALLLKGSVAIKGGKLYAKEKDGKLKRDRHGKPVEVPGMHTLAQRWGFKEHQVLGRVSMIITDKVAKQRNGIMHGRMTDYGKAKFSNQTVLILLAVASAIDAFQRGEIEDSDQPILDQET